MSIHLLSAVSQRMKILEMMTMMELGKVRETAKTNNNTKRMGDFLIPTLKLNKVRIKIYFEVINSRSLQNTNT